MQRAHIKEIESGLQGSAFFINLLEKGQTTVLLMAGTLCEKKKKKAKRELQEKAIDPRQDIKQLY